MNKPIILVTNDDGINAPGLRHLINIMRTIGKVVVVAPQSTMSGTAHSITVRSPLRVEEIVKEKDYEEYSCNGTPVDCVKLGEQIVLRHKPDLLVSGINHGSNASINVIYSGTMAAVLEACIDGIPSIGFSLLDYSSKADFSYCDEYVKIIAENVIKNGLPSGVCLNVNVPAVNGAEIKGIKVCRQAKSKWVEEFDERKDPRQKDYYWLTGRFERLENGKDTDEWALENNYVSVVPVHFDFTAHYAIEDISRWNLGS